MSKPILDISQWQRPQDMDYDRIAQQVRGVIIRAGYTGYSSGKAATDVHFERHYTEFSRLKIPIGVYWICVGDSAEMGIREARECLKRIEGKKIQLGVWADTEPTEDTPQTKYKPQTHGRSQLTAAVLAFVQTITAANYQAGIYASEWWFTHRLNSEHLERWPWWVANYSERPKIRYDMWQHTSRGRLNGYGGNLDLSEINEELNMSTIHLHTPILKRRAPVSALQDQSTITTGDRYKHIYRGLSVRPAGVWRNDGSPYAGHKGIDFAVATGTPVYALYDGTLWADTETRGGKILKLTTASGLEINHRHLSGYARTAGEVKAGDLIAYTGNTGTKSTGPHLHVDIITDAGCHDAYPYVMGIWDQYGKGPRKDDVMELHPQNYAVTDPWEYELPVPAAYIVDTGEDHMPLNIRRSPGTDKAVVGAIRDGATISIDKRCDLPNGQLWGRLEGMPWHWVCLYNKAQWLVKDPPPPAHRHDVDPPMVYQAVEDIQGYSEPGWSGEYRDIAFKGAPVAIVERYNDHLENYFGRTESGIWYLMHSKLTGWQVRGGWPVSDKYTAILDDGTDAIQGDYTEILRKVTEYGGVMQAPDKTVLEVVR